MMRLIDGLQERELVVRTAADDGRRVCVVLTTRGREEAERLAQLTESAVDMVMSRIPKAEHKSISRAISLLRNATEDVHKALCSG